ncbi:MAG: RHS repeat-associated core domain-containing protein [Pseudomonadota bacterium]
MGRGGQRGGGAPVDATYDYDALGSPLWGGTRTDRRKQLGAAVVELDYDGRNRLSRVRESANSGASFGGWQSYAYDNRGNVTNNGKIGFQYRWTDQPYSMTASGAAGDFIYDGNLKRVKQVQGGKTIYSIYSQSGTMLYRDNVTDNETTAYIPGSGGIRLKNGVPDYTHKDHLGSPVAMTDASGAVLWRELYSPYGLKQIDPAANRDNEGYTGHIDDATSGLTYMQARYYDPNIGRFLSNDPVRFAEGGPGYFGRYTYTFNNPVNNVDPDGEKVRTSGNCKKKCKVYDEQTYDRVGSRIKGRTRTLIGVYSRISGPNLDPKKDGQAQTGNPVNGTLNYLLGNGMDGAENIDTRRMHRKNAERMGQSALDGTLSKLNAGGGGTDDNFGWVGRTGDWTAGTVSFSGRVTVTKRGQGFVAVGALTAASEPFDFNSNPNRPNNGSVVAAGRALDLLGGKPFQQDYYGTLNFRFEMKQ